MSIQDNPNIVKIVGTVKELEGRTFLGRNGISTVDDVFHYAHIIIENSDGDLLKFDRVTTNEKIDVELVVGNTATFYFRRIGRKNSVFHIVASESVTRGNNYCSLVRRFDVIRTIGIAIGVAPIGLLFGWIFIGYLSSYIFGGTIAFLLACSVPACVFYFLVLHHTSLLSVRRDSLAVREELERSSGGRKFEGRELKTA